MSLPQRPGVFALEGDWHDDLRRGGSIKPVFDLLAAQEYLQVVHRDVGTTEELNYYSKKWTHSRYKHFRLVYLAFHGNPGKLWVGQEAIKIEDLAELVGDSCQQRAVHFGSCSTMRVSVDRLKAFKKKTGALTVSGYQKDVDWLESAAFEMLLIGAITTYKTPGPAFNYVERTAPELVRRLGWHRV